MCSSALFSLAVLLFLGTSSCSSLSWQKEVRPLTKESLASSEDLWDQAQLMYNNYDDIEKPVSQG
jgi:hypothetical protein